MSVTGIALILFLTFHASMNVVALISAKGYNMICEFLGANWYAVAATVVLMALVLLHFIYAICLTLQNRKARGADRYAITDKPEKVEWASQNMFVLGVIVVLGLLLHFYNFWYNMMFAELAGVENPIPATDGIGYIMHTFQCPVYTIIYLVWLAALWFHLNHGFWSAIQTLGWNGKVWFCRWRVISLIYTTIVILMFAAVAIIFSFGYKPCDYRQCPQGGCPKEMVQECCQKQLPCCAEKAPCCQPQKPEAGCQGAPCPQGGAPAPECGGCPKGAPAPQQGAAPKGGAPAPQQGAAPKGGAPAPKGGAPAPQAPVKK